MKMVEWFRGLSVVKKFAVFIVIVILGLVLADSAKSEPVCGGTEIAEDLASDYHEAPVVTGMMNGAAMQVWASQDGETWTILIITPDKICAVFAGGEIDLHGAEYPGEAM